MVFVMTLHRIYFHNNSTRFSDTYCVVCNVWETSWKKRNVHKPQQRLWLHDQPTMLAGEVSDEKEEAKRTNEQ